MVTTKRGAVRSALRKHNRPGGISCSELANLATVELRQTAGCDERSVSLPDVRRAVFLLKRAGRVEIKGYGRVWGQTATALWGLVEASSAEEEAVDAMLAAYSFDLRDPWAGPGDYGFELVSPAWREAFGELTVDADHTLTMSNFPIDSTDPLSTVPAEIVEGLFEVAVQCERHLRSFLDNCGEASLRRIFLRHVEPLRESLLASVRACMTPRAADEREEDSAL